MNNDSNGETALDRHKNKSNRSYELKRLYGLTKKLAEEKKLNEQTIKQLRLSKDKNTAAWKAIYNSANAIKQAGGNVNVEFYPNRITIKPELTMMFPGEKANDLSSDQTAPIEATVTRVSENRNSIEMQIPERLPKVMKDWLRPSFAKLLEERHEEIWMKMAVECRKHAANMKKPIRWIIYLTRENVMVKPGDLGLNGITVEDQSWGQLCINQDGSPCRKLPGEFLFKPFASWNPLLEQWSFISKGVKTENNQAQGEINVKGPCTCLYDTMEHLKLHRESNGRIAVKMRRCPIHTAEAQARYVNAALATKNPEKTLCPCINDVRGKAEAVNWRVEMRPCRMHPVIVQNSLYEEVKKAQRELTRGEIESLLEKVTKDHGLTGILKQRSSMPAPVAIVTAPQPSTSKAADQADKNREGKSAASPVAGQLPPTIKLMAKNTAKPITTINLEAAKAINNTSKVPPKKRLWNDSLDPDDLQLKKKP